MLKNIYKYILSKVDIHINGSRSWDLRINNEKAYWHFLRGSLGLGESYMNGLWDCDRVDEMICRIVKSDISSKTVRIDLILAKIVGSIFNLQTKRLSKKVAEVHYDLGNDFYSSMLDPYMQYTCGYWASAKNLNQAQENKLDLICRKLMLQPSDRILELGCGWGGFAKFAAEKYGCHITSVNISREQVAYARDICKNLPVKVIHSDYRDVKGTFDKIVSIGMLEHVGYKNYRSFFHQIKNSLKKGSIALIHSIGSNTTSTAMDPWLDKYIFPGSKLPSLKQLACASEPYLIVEDIHNLSVDYDYTLMSWYKNFKKSWPEFEKRYGNRFYRMWTYYLLVCAGLFRARKTQLWQIVFSNGGLEGGYRSIR
jgi:cyclopropane-fatty-acyl-phospholipid synthase